MESGFLLINKPPDWTSHDVIAYIRNIVRSYYKKISLPDEARRAKAGHAGTLDPFATGLLIVGIGREATKRLDEFKALPKTYLATIKLGAISTTYDKTGEIKKKIENKNLKVGKKQIQSVLKNFIGKQTQLPPMYSAKKVGGKKLYELARKGIEIKRKPHKIEIYSLKLLEIKAQMLKIKCQVSTGTYIRTLAHDIGQALGTGAYCEELKRTQIGPYKVEDAEEPKLLTKENLSERLLPVSKIA